YSVISDFPRNIFFSILISVLSLLILISFYVFIAIKRVSFIFYRSRHQYWNNQITELLTIFLSKVDEGNVSDPVSKILPSFRSLPLHRGFIKDLLYHQIITYQSNFTGNAAEKLKELFLRLRLHHLILKKIKSRRMEVKIRGIIDAAQLELEQFSPQIKKLLHHRSSELRIEAQAAYIILNKAHGFDFLDEVKEPIQDWHQLVLLDLIKRLNTNELPLFSNWLSSANRSVVDFCLKLINHFQQFEALPQIVQLLNHTDQEIKCLAIKILGEFEAQEYEQALLVCYSEESTELKAEILKALGRINSGNQLDFLKNESTSDAFEIAFEASAALFAHGSKGIKVLKQSHHQVPALNRQILDQLLSTTITPSYGNLS
ncbi:MAG: hypothetical protein RI924_1496, partial [Bacteroidota bacterium]